MGSDTATFLHCLAEIQTETNLPAAVDSIDRHWDNYAYENHENCVEDAAQNNN